MSMHENCPRCSRPLNPGGLCPVCAPGGDGGGGPATLDLNVASTAGGAGQTAILGAGGAGETMVAGTVERPGAVIGRYKLLEQVGEGGFGTVWMAEQAEPVRRRVALKVIKLGMDTKEVVGRFEAERQALAMMDHPNIARVFDGGMTASGRPFFVMELVRGIPITKFCDAHKLGMEERLALFMHVCYAVQHAHQKGIIHRDIKPSNILVTEQDGEPLPKVIDFGVAKALHQPLTEKTVFTQFEQWVGTPAYMSPEQAGLGALDVDTRSDIYALGVLLYELLTGRLPFTQEELFKTGIEAGFRMIREKEPPKPSNRVTTLPREELTTVATLRHSEPRKLSRLLRGELDWIVMKAMEKDRKRRYETAGALAMDLQRYMQHEPVSAAAPSWSYQFGKVARRHRLALGVGAGFALILMAATALSLWHAGRATRAEAEARRAKVLAEEQRGQAEANFARARDAVESYLTRVADDAKLKEADFHELRKQLLETAVPFYDQFVAQKSADPKLRSDQAGALGKLAVVYRAVGELSKAEAASRSALAIAGRLADDFPAEPDYRHDAARLHDSFGSLLAQRGGWSGAEAEYRRALEIAGKLAVEFPDKPEYRQTLASSHGNLGILLRARGDSTEAEAEYRRALSLQERLADRFPAEPENRQALARTYGMLANLLSQRGQSAEAETAYHRTLEILGKLAGDFPAVPEYRVDLANAQHNLANLLGERGHSAEAEAGYRRALDTREKLAADFPTVPEYRAHLANSHHNLAGLLSQRGQAAEAEAAYRRALDTTAKLAADFPGVPDYRQELAKSHGSLGNLLAQRGQPADAEAAYRSALEIEERLVTDFPAVPIYRVNLANARHSLGNLLSQHGQPAEAEAAYRRALEIAGQLAADFPTVPAYRLNLANTQHNLGNLLGKMRHADQAEAAYRTALEIQEKLAGEFPATPDYLQELAKSHGSLGNLFSQSGRSAEAEAAYRRALAIQEKLAGDFPAVPAYQSVLGSTLNNLAMVLHNGKQWEPACEFIERAIIHQRKALDADPKNTIYRQFLCAHQASLSQACIGMGDHAAAVASALELPKLQRQGWQEYHRAAGLVARSVPLAQNDAALTPAEREQTAAAYATQAVDLLRQAVANGCTDPARLKSAKEFSAIRSRPDFQVVAGDSDAPGGSGGK